MSDQQDVPQQDQASDDAVEDQQSDQPPAADDPVETAIDAHLAGDEDDTPVEEAHDPGE